MRYWIVILPEEEKKKPLNPANGSGDTEKKVNGNGEGRARELHCLQPSPTVNDAVDTLSITL